LNASSGSQALILHTCTLTVTSRRLLLTSGDQSCTLTQCPNALLPNDSYVLNSIDSGRSAIGRYQDIQLCHRQVFRDGSSFLFGRHLSWMPSAKINHAGVFRLRSGPDPDRKALFTRIA
jgi:hypothetical protein